MTDACAAVILSNYTGLHVEFTGANLIMLKLCSLTLGILLSDPPLLNKRPFQWIVSLFKNDLSLLFFLSAILKIILIGLILIYFSMFI